MTQKSTQKLTKNPHVTIHRKDYTAPAYWVNTVEMGFDLDPAATRVATRITLQRNSASPNKDVELLGDGAKLVALRMNGKTLRKGIIEHSVICDKPAVRAEVSKPRCCVAVYPSIRTAYPVLSLSKHQGERCNEAVYPSIPQGERCNE